MTKLNLPSKHGSKLFKEYKMRTFSDVAFMISRIQFLKSDWIVKEAAK